MPIRRRLRARIGFAKRVCRKMEQRRLSRRPDFAIQSSRSARRVQPPQHRVCQLQRVDRYVQPAGPALVVIIGEIAEFERNLIIERIRAGMCFRPVSPWLRCSVSNPSLARDLLEPDELKTEPELKITHYIDSFGNRCSRFVAPPGLLPLSGSTLIRDSDRPDEVNLSACEAPAGDLPDEVLSYLLNNRYCEVDRLSNIACELFGDIQPGRGGCKPSAIGCTIQSRSTSARSSNQDCPECLH